MPLLIGFTGGSSYLCRMHFLIYGVHDLISCSFILILHVCYGFRACRREAHVWVKDLGRQVYLGAYDEEQHAAEACDVAMAILKSKGPQAATNLEISRYLSAQHRLGYRRRNLHLFQPPRAD